LVEAFLQFFFERIGLRDLLLRRGRRAILPAVRQRLGGVYHPLAFLAPPVDYQLVVVREPDFVDAGRRLTALAAERNVSITHVLDRYRMGKDSIIVPKKGNRTVR
jgi:hypothetical protein